VSRLWTPLRDEVALPVLLQLRLPKFQARFWHSSKLASFLGMPVPKTSMYKNDFTPRAEDDVRFARQVSNVKSVAVAQTVDEAANCHL